MDKIITLFFIIILATIVSLLLPDDEEITKNCNNQNTQGDEGSDIPLPMSKPKPSDGIKNPGE